MSSTLLTRLVALTASLEVERIGWVLVHSLWQFCLLAVVGLLLCQVQRKHSAAARYGMLVSLMVLSASAPLVTWFALGGEPAEFADASSVAAPPAVAIAQGATGRSRAEPSSVKDAEVAGQLSDFGDLAANPDMLATDQGARKLDDGLERMSAGTFRSKVVDALRPWLSTIVAVWSLGVLACALRPVLGWCMVWRLCRVGVTAADESVRHALARLMQTLAVRRSVEVLQSTLVDAPVVVGCFRSVILLPVSLVTGLPPAQLHAILAHELAHVRRFDYLVNLLQTLVETLFFYHPCIWWLSHRIRVERENCCDDWVVLALGDRLQYCRALLAIEEYRGAAAVLALRARDGSLLSRIQRLSGIPTAQAAPHAGGSAALVSAGVAVAGVLWAMTTGFADTDARVADWGAESHGLRCRLVALSPEVNDEAPELNNLAKQFTRSADMTFGVELKNVSSETLTLAGIRYGEGYADTVRGTLRTEMLAPHLFDFEFTNSAGKPLNRTEREYFDSWVVLMSASTHELRPGQSITMVLRPGKFDVPMDYDLAPGSYRARVRYRGPDDALRQNVRKHSPNKPILNAWPHEVSSNSVEFAIEQASRRAKPEDLVWGKPVEGLRATIEYRLPNNGEGDPLMAPGVPLGTSLGVVFHVQNVSDKPITFVSETGRQGDDVLVTDENGNKIEVESVWISGWPIDVAWRIAPGEVAQLHVLAPAINRLSKAGRYTVRYTIRFNSRVQKDEAGNVIFPRPGDYDKALDTGDTPLFLSQASAAANQAQDASPFRLPDHWIIKDVRFVSDGKQVVTVSIQGGVNVRKWDVPTRKLISEIKLAGDSHGTAVRPDTVQLSADGRRVIAATDAYVGIWDAASGELLKKLLFPTKEWEYDCVRCLDCSSDLSVIVAGLGTTYSRTTLAYNGYGIVWDGASGEVKRLVTHKNGYYFRDIAVSSDGERFATCNEHGGGVSIWETSSGKLLQDFSEEISSWKSPAPELIKNNMIGAVALSRDGKLLAISGTFGVKLVDSASGKLLRRIDAPYRFSSGNTRLAFSADGSQLARVGASSADRSYSVPIWSTTTGKKRYELSTEANAAAFSNDGTAIAIGSSDFYEALSIWPLSGKADKSFSHPPTAYPRINRVEENTHVHGQKAEAFIARWKTMWGSEQHGIQYGLALTVPTTQFHVGERVLMAAFLRNVGKEPQQIDVRPDMFGNPPRVIDATGQPIVLEKRPLLGDIAHYRETLQPGEAFGPLYLNFGLGENPRPGRQSWTPYWSAPVAGKYKLTHAVSFHVAAPGASDDAASKEWRGGQLTSGTIEFEVIEGTADSSARNLPAGDESEDAAAANTPGDTAAYQHQKPLPEKSQVNLPWRATGRVTDGDGKPMAGVTVRAATGIGTLMGGGSTVTDAKGRYDLRFGFGIMMRSRDDEKPSPQTQYALISAQLSGYFEKNFNRQGNGIASLQPVDADIAKEFGVEPDQVCLPDKPREIDFEMLPAAHVAGTLIDENDQPLKDYSVSLTGDQLPPGSSVLAQVRTDAEGRFTITDIPTTVPFQFEVRKPRDELKPPWHDSWASGPFLFADPGQNDLAASLKTQQAAIKRLTVQTFKLKIIGEGVHGKVAVARAAKREPVGLVPSVKLSAAAASLNEWTLELTNP